jgi:hypothetical protein
MVPMWVRVGQLRSMGEFRVQQRASASGLSGSEERLGFRPVSAMILRPALRFILWGCVSLAALLISRSANAAAPMCGENGASVIAPAPILPARDVRIESGSRAGCDAPSFLRTAGAPSFRTQSVPSNDPPTEAWIRPVQAGLVKSQVRDACALPTDDRGPAAGHERGVFRPPRSLG